MSDDKLPISRKQAIRLIGWIKGCFGKEIQAAVFAPFTIDHICGIICQETGYVLIGWIDDYTPHEILAGCVFDATGDTVDTEGERNAFPRNTSSFRAKFGDDFSNLLIEEGNKSRKMRGFKPWGKIYKGYGIFQYDLQFVLEDEAFFRLLQWHDFRRCLDRCLGELRRTYAREGNIPEAIRAYNGSGPRARQYRENVLVYTEISKGISK